MYSVQTTDNFRTTGSLIQLEMNDRGMKIRIVALFIRKSLVQPKLNRDNTTEIRTETRLRIMTGRFSRETKPGINLTIDGQYLNNVRYQLRNNQHKELNSHKEILHLENNGQVL